MQTSTESWGGRVALMVAHCAGMIDLVALPVWVGALIAQYGFSPAQAGGLATLFLIGAVVSSLVCAPRFNKIDARLMAAVGFALAAVCVLRGLVAIGLRGVGAMSRDRRRVRGLRAELHPRHDRA